MRRSTFFIALQFFFLQYQVSDVQTSKVAVIFHMHSDLNYKLTFFFFSLGNILAALYIYLFLWFILLYLLIIIIHRSEQQPHLPFITMIEICEQRIVLRETILEEDC
ncbi:hypothetical protein K458DRAFT_74902 [Lentithecium fluviatile CBS 122367]|uniref:Uncharacterized protein n=1 Tax=Lentithecium fluviatile CBS 122367 TaxID=1168545 RepID=A0A6G1IUT6_9PLEO|nr:hypothetical protein K458DRAFT_74902 [Lentithecium fluviatile CBS 122367]